MEDDRITNSCQDSGQSRKIQQNVGKSGNSHGKLQYKLLLEELWTVTADYGKNSWQDGGELRKIWQ
jgi:hypothetical protein